MSELQNHPAPQERKALRAQLLTERRAWLATPAAHAAHAAVAHHLLEVLDQLEPQCLGLFWPLDGEFNAVSQLLAHGFANPVQWALPYAWQASAQQPRRMDYRRWDGLAPTIQDECGIAACTGAVVVPDVVLAPCVGFTREGYRLGYGGGYFDRWLSSHPGVTSIGLAWGLSEASFAAEPHDQALTLLLTEREVISP